MNRSLSGFWASICLLLGATSLVSGQFSGNVSKVGTTAANFLEVGVGARPVALGGAYVALAEDVSSIYWNPAGLARIRNFQVIMNHAEWLADINFEYLGLAKRIPGIGVAGLAISAVNMSDMEVRTVANPDGTGEMFSVSNLAIQFSYARAVTDRFSIGFSSKYVYEQIWHMSASAIAFDFGTLYRTTFNGLTIGMSISNFGTSMQMMGRDTQIRVDIDPLSAGNNDNIRGSLATDHFPLPLIFRFGIMMPVKFTNGQELFFMVDGLHPNNNHQSVNIGMEYALGQRLFLRGGYKSLFLEEGEEGFTAGIGFKAKAFRYFGFMVDYAYQDFGRLLNTQFFTLRLMF